MPNSCRVRLGLATDVLKLSPAGSPARGLLFGLFALLDSFFWINLSSTTSTRSA